VIPAAVLFDFDGTLADSEPLISESLLHAMRMHGYDVTPQEVRAIFGPPLDEMVRLLAGPIGAEKAQAIRDTYFQHYNGVQLPRIRPIAGAEALLDALDAHGVRKALVTNKVEASAHRQLAAMHWERRFDVVVGADTTAHPKPAPDPALFALDQLGVPATQAAFVGDQEPDIACGLAAHVSQVIALALGRSAASLDSAGATHVVTSLNEVRMLLLQESGA
jgi:HAD superfamily hydrolase (TIGR01509 family)